MRFKSRRSWRLAIWACVALATLGLSTPRAAAVEIESVTVGDPGNAADTAVMNDGTTGYGSVDCVYQIGAFETTNAQYAEFLNAVAGSDPNGLYNTQMASSQFGGIIQSGSSPDLMYSLKSGMANKPVVFVSFYDALRFANWLHNGQPVGAQDPSTTEDGAYTLLGSNPVGVTRNAEATVFLTSEDEWYKAAYYDSLSGGSGGYFEFPTGTNLETSCVLPPGDDNSANCWPATNPAPRLTDTGAYFSSESPNGTLDQGGNVWEWNESIILIRGSNRGVRGGAFNTLLGSELLGASFRDFSDPTSEILSIGFRVATVPEPDSGLLGAVALATLLGLARIRRR